jgi:hypothetical protein
MLACLDICECCAHAMPTRLIAFAGIVNIVRGEECLMFLLSNRAVVHYCDGMSPAACGKQSGPGTRFVIVTLSSTQRAFLQPAYCGYICRRRITRSFENIAG